jgi:hypothetical protein
MIYVADVLLAICFVGFLISFGFSFYHITLGRGRYSHGCAATLIGAMCVAGMMFIAPYSHLAPRICKLPDCQDRTK